MGELLGDRTWERSIFSDGWTESKQTVDVVEPATGQVLAQVGLATTEDVDAAVARAVVAQREWAALSYRDRAKVLSRAADLWLEHTDEIGEWTGRETGAIRPMAYGQGATGADECDQAAALASAPYGEMLRSAQPRLSFSRQVPVGVVGVIAPFNAPILLALRSVAPALALGNAVVLKPDPRTPVVGGVVFARIFEEAGLPPGLLHVLPGGADVGEALVRHPDVPVLAFTGSTRGGQAIAAAAAPYLKRLHLELGGNSAMVVLDDADLERAVGAGARGSFIHQGQICMATGRHLVHESIAREYVAGLAEVARAMPVGDPTQAGIAIGPLIDASQRDRVHQIVTDSVNGGATVEAGGTYDGLFYAPTVLTGVTTSTPAYAQEVFGPVAPVMTFGSLEEAAALARDSDYGLSLGIITRDVMKGLALADLVPTGLVHINDQTINDEAVVPFGGVGLSGNGARHGGQRANLEAFTDTQWVTVRAEPPA
ncbi:aldehyde dehydrogenase family protein [Nocardioides sp. cx-173]|uniref:aldehyde dehydrogenase family protein n=1 Tax=Nocardioides sp. cx-173 TaxID=2898796 RepID=UPI001E491079|nr:aldehyde dehydrogenase family protein [Nocardioides sp. cx-173]MCD4526595.1 aldehyde dehydrogenase family protein [Nocardioides sp. cx-173]UGB40690.1 aldehyde dehydrogenase family protein [Nocardioides sp. cx-173]